MTKNKDNIFRILKDAGLTLIVGGFSLFFVAFGFSVAAKAAEKQIYSLYSSNLSTEEKKEKRQDLQKQFDGLYDATVATTIAAGTVDLVGLVPYAIGQSTSTKENKEHKFASKEKKIAE